MHLVLVLLFVRHQFVSRRDRDIDANAERIPGMLRMIRFLNRHRAADDVIAKPIEPGGFAVNESVDVFGFFNAAIGDFDRQLHGYVVLM
jgi:predicted lactoylglutathione lyase